MSQRAEKIHRAALFLDKAHKHLGWLHTFIGEMMQFGNASNLPEFERALHACLLLTASIHEALMDCARIAVLTKQQDALTNARSSDELLLYLWKARDVDTADALVTRAEGTEAMCVVVDQQKVEALLASMQDVTPKTAIEKLMFYLFEVTDSEALGDKIKAGLRPAAERLAAAGLSLHYAVNSFTFCDFYVRDKGRSRLITAPTSHAGEPINPSAFASVQKAHLFYLRKYGELRREIDAQLAHLFASSSSSNSA